MGQSQSRGDQASRADHYSVQQGPDIRPGRLRKCDVISDPKVFKHIDSHVLRVNLSFRSVSETKDFLIRPAKSDLDKVRAFYVYATIQNWKLRNKDTKQPENHKLFEQLCHEANIPCRCVAGFGKGNARAPHWAFEAGSGVNHCWNLVHVQGQWWHVDCAWGECKTNDKTVSALGEIYFLCDPIDFIQSHLPWEDGDSQASRKLQLLKKPWSLEEFNRHVRVDDKALEFGIRLGTLSHTTSRIEMSRELVLQVRADATKMAGLLGELHQKGGPQRGHTLVRDVGGGVYRVRVMPPEQGDYWLRLYGKAQGRAGDFTCIVSYAISCRKACNALCQYPKNQNAQADVVGRAQGFGITPPTHSLDVLEAKGGKLDVSLGLTRPIRAKCLLKHTESESDSEPLDRYVLLTASSDALRIQARFPHAGFYTLQVVVLDSGANDGSVQLALTLIARCRKRLKKCHAFPETYPTTTLWQCRLLEPQSGSLPENSVVKVRLTSPFLKRMEPGTLVREGEVWRGLLMTQELHSTVTLFGSDKMDGPLQSVFKFKVTDFKSMRSVMSSRPLPALLPVSESRSDVIPNPQKTFRAVDKHARQQVPESAKASVPALARHLTKHASNDIAKARAFFCWMAHNIRYDEDVKHQPNDPETVLSRGSAVCKGYSGLFRALCSYVGIPCHFVSGLDKAEESSSRPRAFRPPRASEPLPLTASGQSGHAWNVVLVGGCWRHVDCTWGAGKVKDGVFCSDFQEQYFLTDAEDFVARHFPLMEGNHERSARFQLLAQPWTLQQFNARVKPSDSAVEFGVQTSHPDAKVVFSGEVELEIRVNAKKMDDLMAELTRGKEDSEVKGHSVVLRAGEGVYKVKVAPRERGRYKLTLLGHPCAGRKDAALEERAVFISLLEYDLECTMISRAMGQCLSANKGDRYASSPRESQKREAVQVLTFHLPRQRQNDVIAPPTAHQGQLDKGPNHRPPKKHHRHSLKSEGPSAHQGAQDKSPNLRPPKKSHHGSIPDPKIFQKVDQHAVKASSHVCSSVAELARYLMQAANTDVEKARAFYRWITDNIRYDTDQYFSGKFTDCDAETVLRTRRGVCQGYAELFLALCKEALIPCRVIMGFSKGYNYNPEVPFTPQMEPNHAWNLVYLRGDWRFVECTWGSGFLNGRTFIKCFRDVFFLTEPEDFVKAHFPYMDGDLEGSAQFQLLNKPWDLDTFNRRAEISGVALEYGLKTLTHRDWNIEVSKEVVVKVRLDKAKQAGLMAQLHRGEVQVAGHTLVRKGEDGVFSVTVRPPAPGKYKLRLLAQNLQQHNTYDDVLTYTIQCTEVMPNLHPYPKEHMTLYGPAACAEEYGLTADARNLDVLVSKDGSLDFKVNLTRRMHAEFQLTFAEDNIPDLEHHVMPSYGDNVMRVHLRLPREGFYELIVFGKHPTKSTKTCDPVLILLVECLKGKKGCEPFPRRFGGASELRCSLVEPLTLYLPARQQVKIEVTSPLLKRMLPNTLKQEGNTWRGIVTTTEPGQEFTLYGSAETSGKLDGLFSFRIK